MILTAPSILTLSTLSPSVFFYDCVHFAKWVAFWAFCFSGIDPRPSNASKKIFSLRDRFEVARIDTMSYSTNMINLKAFFNRAIGHRVRKAMCELRVKSGQRNKLSVSRFINKSCPKPAAAGLVNFFPKAIFCWPRLFSWLHSERYILAHTKIQSKGVTY